MLPIAILAGGFAKRLGDITRDIPKSLVQINDKPFVEWQLNLLATKGLSRVVFCVSHKSDMIQDYVGNGSKFNLEVSYSIDGAKQLGTGGAIRKALPLLGENFMVIYGDSYLNINYFEAEQAFLRTTKKAMMTIYKNNDLHDTSNVLFTKKGLEIYDKWKRREEFNYIDYGLSFFSKQVFEKYPLGENFDLSAICKELAEKRSLEGYEVFNRFYEVGSVEGIRDFLDYTRRIKNDI
jgi:MurNAc alpha-1-phosphate uridylyltransferase